MQRDFVPPLPRVAALVWNGETFLYVALTASARTGRKSHENESWATATTSTPAKKGSTATVVIYQRNQASAHRHGGSSRLDVITSKEKGLHEERLQQAL